MTHSAHRRYFCCCVPTRIAVLILSALTLIGAIVNGWAVFKTLRDYTTTSGQAAWSSLDTTAKAILIIDGVLVALLAICALAGFVGALVRSRRLVGMYVFALWFFLVAGVVLGSLAIWVAFKDRAAWVQACQERITDANVEKGCADAYKPALIVTIVVFVIIKLIQLYLCVIVGRYKHQLDDEHAAHRHQSSTYASGPFGVVGNRSAGGEYAPVDDVEKYGHSHTYSQSYAPAQAAPYHSSPYAAPQYASR